MAYLIKVAAGIASLTVVAVQYFTFLNFGPFRYQLSAITMLLPFLISIRRIEHGVLLTVLFTPLASLPYYSLNVRYSSMLAAIFLSVLLAWLLKILFKGYELARSPIDLPVVTFSGIVILSLALVSYKLRGELLADPGSEISFSVLRTSFVFLCGPAFFFLLVNNFPGPRKVLWAMALGGLVVGILGIVEFVWNTEVFRIVPDLVGRKTCLLYTSPSPRDRG